MHIWLGDTDALDETVLDVLESARAGFYGSAEDRDAFIEEINSEDSCVFGERFYKATYYFVNRIYWRRGWTVQELILGGPYALIHSLTGVISVGEMMAASDAIIQQPAFMFNLSKYLSQQDFDLTDFKLRNERLHHLMDMIATDYLQHAIPLLVLVDIARSSEVLDDRDRIYGIMGLMDPELLQRIVPDYKLDVSQVYTDFTKALVTYSQNLDSLTRCGTSNLAEAGWPSWVPDWRQKAPAGLECQGIMTNDDHLSASAGRQAHPRFPSDGLLVVEGVKIDEVESHIDADEDGSKTMIGQGSKNAYASRQDTREALWQTLVAGIDLDHRAAPSDFAALVNLPIDSKDSEDEEEDPNAPLDINTYWHDTFLHIRAHFFPLQLGASTLKTYFTPDPSFVWPPDNKVQEALAMALNVSLDRKLVITKNGHLGQAPIHARRGDGIYVLFGSDRPVVLRWDEGLECYRLVGDVYVNGVMRGEALEWVDGGRLVVESVVIG